MKHLPAVILLAFVLVSSLLTACKRDKVPESLLPSDSDLPPPASVDDFTMENFLSEFPGHIRSSEYRKGPQLVIFFLPDDPPCAESIPEWNAIQQEHAARGFTTIGLIPDSRPSADLRHLVAELPTEPAFPTGQADSSVIAAFGTPTAIPVVPTAFLLDANGAVARYYQGHIRPEWIREDIDALLLDHPLPDHTPAGILPEDNEA